MELQKTTKQVNTVTETIKVEPSQDEVLFDEIPLDNEEMEFTENEFEEQEDLPATIQTITEIEETVVLNSISMPSRKLKLKISTNLLYELEKMQVNFKLN